MKLGKNIREWIAAALFVVGAVLFISSFRVSLPSGDTTGAARRVERVLNRRMALLDTYAGQALAQDPAQWMTLEGLPRDMVVYRYCRDTLQSWSHAFPIANDNINQRVYVPFLADPRVGAESPLLQAEDSVSFVCMGTHWYLLKSYGDAAVRVIAGVEVMDDLPMGGAYRVNPRLRLSRRRRRDAAKAGRSALRAASTGERGCACRAGKVLLGRNSGQLQDIENTFHGGRDDLLLLL